MVLNLTWRAPGERGQGQPCVLANSHIPHVLLNRVMIPYFSSADTEPSVTISSR